MFAAQILLVHILCQKPCQPTPDHQSVCCVDFPPAIIRMARIIQDNCDVTTTQMKTLNCNPTTTNVNGALRIPIAGQQYIHWIASTKQKLQEREVNLLSIRLEIVKTAIHRTVAEFNEDPINYRFGINIDMKRVNAIFKIVNCNLITLCMNFLKQILSEWNGIDLSRSTKEFTTFRKYFVVSKNWFDQRKKSILTQHFWLNILESVREFSLSAASDVMEGYRMEYSRYLLFTLIWAIFASKTQFSSTKPQPVIPGGTIKDTNHIKRFLEKVDDSLSMMKLIQMNGKECEQEVSAQQTLQFILSQVKLLSTKYQQMFHCKIQKNNTYNSHYFAPPIPYEQAPIHMPFIEEWTPNNEYPPMYNDDNLYYNNLTPNTFNSNTSSSSTNSSVKPPVTVPQPVVQRTPRISNPFLPNINAYNGANNSSNLTNICAYNDEFKFMDYTRPAAPMNYGPIHHSSYNVSDVRHSPAFHTQSNPNNNCYQCNCNNCYV